ncbi:ribonuclease H-like domain-containing protein, partial [Mycena galopus ATCC 62051]
FRQFFNKYIPGATLPDRRALSGPILNNVAGDVVVRARLETNGKLATYAEDGWSNCARTHVDTSVISVETKPFLLRTHDMTGRPKTGDELYRLVLSGLAYAAETYGVEIIAACTDDGPDGKKMRRLLKASHPWIAVFECWAHQAHLITGNYLAIEAPWMHAAKQAIEIIKFFNHHQTPLDLLREQERLTIGHFLVLLLPVLTRWLSNYTAIRRLKRLRPQIQVVIISNEERIRKCLGAKPEQISEAEYIIALCKDSRFWENLDRIGKHLEPLAIASNILQAPYCRLDMVLLTLGNLYRIFSALQTSDSAVTAAVHGSLERRFAKTDQELMILAVFFNPFIRTRPFNQDVFPPIMFFHLVVRMYKRLLQQDPAGDTEFSSTFNDYHNNTGFLSMESMALDWHQQAYIKSGVSPDIVSIWRSMSGTRLLTGRAGFVALAVRVLSILPNSAGPERAFSEFGMIHTKHRNRLAPEKVHKTSLVRSDRMRTHAEAGLIPKRKIRHCSMADDELEVESQASGGADVDSETRDSIENDFDSMANVLINLAQQEDADDAAEDDEPAADVPASSQRPNPATAAVRVAGSRVPAYKKILLQDLFSYPVVGTSEADVEFFWHAGRTGLDAEERELEAEQVTSAEADSSDSHST